MISAAREQRIEVQDAAVFGKVAVLFGGSSSEAEVSRDSGTAVLDALCTRGVNAHAFDPAKLSMHNFAAAGYDRVWNVLHGPGGEDGVLQGALQWLNVPYTGSGVMASALAMDKIRSKHLFRNAGISTPEYHVIESPGDAAVAADACGYPLVIKPAAQGSSVGMSKVFEHNELRAAVDLALGFGGAALAERCIVGDELTVAIVAGEVFPSIRIETPRVFYDYRAKYQADSTKYFCPGCKDDAQEQRLRGLAMASYNELGCEGWARVDFMVSGDGDPQVLEVNTVPGMTSHSLVPIAALEAGIDFTELCWRVLETSFVDRPGQIAGNNSELDLQAEASADGA